MYGKKEIKKTGSGKAAWKMQKRYMGRKSLRFGSAMAASLMLAILFCLPVSAAPADPTAIIQGGFDVIYGIIAAIVSALGSIFLLWGLFEWTQSLNTQDGGAQSIAFKRIASGLVAILGPQLIPIIQSAIGA